MPPTRQVVVEIGQANDASEQRYGLAFQAARIAGAVQPLVVAQGDLRCDVGQSVGVLDDFRADGGMTLELLALLGAELTSFLQQRLGYPCLADVVEQRADAERRGCG
ncbi:MAG: hypothetical protein P8009_03565 [Gammaproteobacteria bacterium]